MWLVKFILKKCERSNWNIGRIFMNPKTFEKVVHDHKTYETLDMGSWYYFLFYLSIRLVKNQHNLIFYTDFPIFWYIWFKLFSGFISTKKKQHFLKTHMLKENLNLLECTLILWFVFKMFQIFVRLKNEA